MERWRRYWFAEGGRLSAAGVRIALAASMLLTLWRLPRGDWAVRMSRLSPERYDPVGILQLLGEAMPSPAFMEVVTALAWLATAAMLVGLASRVSAAVSLLGVLILTSFLMSFSPGWSHGFNVVLLAALAFSFARGGDALSLDRLLRKLGARRGLCRPPSSHPGDYQWSVRLVQLACALMFFNAAVLKLAAGRLSPHAWALSDSLRHHLLVTFDLQQLERTAVADWLIDSAFLYQTAATLNLVSQLAPIVAAVFVRRPVVRLFCGGFFLVESIALGVVMDLWNPQFFPLAAVFVDWDWVAAKLRRRPPEESPAKVAPAPSPLKHGFIAGFLGLYLVSAFAYPPIDVRLNLYPFTSFPLFSKVRAKKPYGEHQSYEVFASRVEVDTEPEPERLRRWVDRHHRWREWRTLKGRADLERRLRKVMKNAAEGFRVDRVTGARMMALILQAPPYPAKARFEERRIAVMGEILPGGAFRSLLGRIGRDRRGLFLETETGDFGPSRLELAVHVDDSPAPTPLPYERREDRFYIDPPPGDARTYVAIATGEGGKEQRYFIAREGRLKY